VRIDLPRPRWEGDVKADPRFAQLRARHARFAARLTMRFDDEQIIEELGPGATSAGPIYDHPNLIRLASVTVFFCCCGIFGRKTASILFTYPTAVTEASSNSSASGLINSWRSA